VKRISIGFDPAITFITSTFSSPCFGRPYSLGLITARFTTDCCDITELVDPTGFVSAFRDLSCQVQTQEHGVLLIPRSGALNKVIGCCACFRDLSCQVQTQEHGVLLIPRSGALSMYEE